MEKSIEKSLIVQFAECLCKGREPLAEVIHFHDDEERLIAGEVKLGRGKVFYLLLYNGHFWDAETGMYSYLGPNPELAALTARSRMLESEQYFDEKWELDDEEEDLIRGLFEDDGFEDDEDDCLEVRVRKYNPEPMGPTIGMRLMKSPDEWKERQDKSLLNWTAYNPYTGESRPMLRDPEGFGKIANRIQEILGTMIGLEVYRHEDGEEYAAEIHLGRNKDDKMVTAYFVKVGGLYYDTNSGQILESLGVTPKIVAEVFCERLGCFEFPEDDDEHEFFMGDSAFEKDMENHRHDPNAKFLIPEQWSEMMEQAQRDAEDPQGMEDARK